VSVDIRAQLDFLNLDGLLLFPGLGRFLLGLVFVFSVVHDLADRWVRVSHLDQIKSRFLGTRYCVLFRDESVI
jgi:hypothetical protein